MLPPVLFNTPFQKRIRTIGLSKVMRNQISALTATVGELQSQINSLEDDKADLYNQIDDICDYIQSHNLSQPGECN